MTTIKGSTDSEGLFTPINPHTDATYIRTEAINFHEFREQHPPALCYNSDNKLVKDWTGVVKPWWRYFNSGKMQIVESLKELDNGEKIEQIYLTVPPTEKADAQPVKEVTAPLSDKSDVGLLQRALDYLHSNVTASIVYENPYDYSCGIKGAEVDYFPETAEELLQEMGIQGATDQEKLMQGEIDFQWQDIKTTTPKDGEVYDVIVHYNGNETKVRYGLIFKLSHPIADFGPYFQDEVCYNMNLYEILYRLNEDLITHFKKHIPMPDIYLKQF